LSDFSGDRPKSQISQRIFLPNDISWKLQHLVFHFQSKHSNLFLYLPDKDYKLGIIAAKQNDLLEMFLEGKIDVFVSDIYISLPSAYQVKYFDHYPKDAFYIYLKKP